MHPELLATDLTPPRLTDKPSLPPQASEMLPLVMAISRLPDDPAHDEVGIRCPLFCLQLEEKQLADFSTEAEPIVMPDPIAQPPDADLSTIIGADTSGISNQVPMSLPLAKSLSPRCQPALSLTPTLSLPSFPVDSFLAPPSSLPHPWPGNSNQSDTGPVHCTTSLSPLTNSTSFSPPTWILTTPTYINPTKLPTHSHLLPFSSSIPCPCPFMMLSYQVLTDDHNTH
ncbi:hypothetical protein BD779DRAFT_474017 [Infundibulicybe gibba]|nr:hypothetical protein BD779DRAFT_474017 [Infundibulicybe gibba]